MKTLLNVIRVIFEWLFIIAILTGAFREIYYQYQYYGVLSITWAFPLLVFSVWVYVKIEAIVENHKAKIKAPTTLDHNSP